MPSASVAYPLYVRLLLPRTDVAVVGIATRADAPVDVVAALLPTRMQSPVETVTTPLMPEAAAAVALLAGTVAS